MAKHKVKEKSRGSQDRRELALEQISDNKGKDAQRMTFRIPAFDRFSSNEIRAIWRGTCGRTGHLRR